MPAHAPSTPSGTDRDDAELSDRATSVGDRATPDEPVRVGVLSPHNSKETKAILNAVRALGHEPVWIRDENMVSRIEDGEVCVSPRVDVLINRALVTKSERPLEELQLAALYGTSVPVLNPPTAVQTAIHKYRAAATLSAAGLPIPDAYFTRSPDRFDDWTEHIPVEAVHKRTIGTNGQQMDRVSADDIVHPRLQDGQAFVQEFLDQGVEQPYDIRVYVVDGEIVGAMRRYAPTDEWRTNVALGGEVEDITDRLGKVPRRLARRATDVLRLDIAGVDLVPVDGEWYVLEVNATAGFKGLFSATGVSPAPYIAGAGIQRANGTVEEDRVTALAGELDDSVPECKPDRPASDGGPKTIGYTSRVRVRGGEGVETAAAKSDTGAKRTSIDAALAGRIGAGPLAGTTEVRSGTRQTPETRPLVELDIWVDGSWRTVTASVTDRSQMRYPVLLGRDILSEYTVDMSRRIEE